jgi:hypothetical protein
LPAFCIQTRHHRHRRQCPQPRPRDGLTESRQTPLPTRFHSLILVPHVVSIYRPTFRHIRITRRKLARVDAPPNTHVPANLLP